MMAIAENPINQAQEARLLSGAEKNMAELKVHT